MRQTRRSDGLAICSYCFLKLNGPKEPYRVVAEKGGRCALCSKDVGDVTGIYYRLWLEEEPEE